MKVLINSIKVKSGRREINQSKVEELSQSIKEIGLINPITVSKDYTLIAGNHRLEACKKLDYIDIEVNILSIEGLRAELAEIDENLIRNELHYIDRGNQESRRKEIYEELFPKTKKGNSQALGMNKSIGNNVSAETATTFVSDTANKTGRSERVIQEDIQIAKNIAPEIKEIIKEKDISKTDALKVARLQPQEQKAVIQKVSDRNISVNEALKAVKYDEKEVRREERRQENSIKIEKAQSLDDMSGLFQCILMDPPWDWGDEGDINQMGRAKPDYATMPYEDLLKLPVQKLSDDNCHLYLWVTNRSLPKAFNLIEAWGFRYITCITWVKPSFGLGNYFRGSTEQLLFAVKGSLPLKRKDVGTHFNAARGNGHSKKPNEVYDLIESCSSGPYIELFSRNNRDGWVSWGEGNDDI